VLSSGAVDVTVSWGEAVGYGMTANRKEIARDAETAVRRMTARALRSPAVQSSATQDATPSVAPALEQT
jgi:1-acyl-sn-glycerol-3-phosphate acyltransferase